MEVKHRGRLRKKGQRLPTLEAIAGDKHTHWYTKKLTTFSDALALVKETLFI
jgi:hypothetical protein